MAANAYAASFDATGKFTKTFYEDLTAAKADGRERAAAGHFQTKAVSFDGKTQVYTGAVLPTMQGKGVQS